MSNRIVHGLDADTYHAGPEVSNSGLGLLARSPWHWWSWHRAPHRPPSPQRAGQLEGTLLHCAVLEPDEFDRRYVVGPDATRSTKVWKDFAALHPDRLAIKPDEAAAAKCQAISVRALPDVAALLSRGHSEVSAYWTDPETGVACRCRPDWVHPVDDKRVILLDCKTYSDASKPEFSRQIARKGYARQDAFYSDGYAQAAGVEVIGFVFVAVVTEWQRTCSTTSRAGTAGLSTGGSWTCMPSVIARLPGPRTRLRSNRFHCPLGRSRRCDE